MNPVMQRLAFDILHRDERTQVIILRPFRSSLINLKDTRDVGMVELVVRQLWLRDQITLELLADHNLF
jgi:hypothetical protein